MKPSLCFFVLCSLFLSGCASIFSGTSQRVNFNSSPDAAKVSVAGTTCTTPCSVELSKGEQYPVVYEKSGYQLKQDYVEKEFDPISLLNFFGLVGWIVDFGTGAVWKYSPSSYHGHLNKTQK